MGRTGIDYKEIMALGFTEQKVDDNVYYNQYGYGYSIITLDISKKLYFQWAKETRLCELIRINKDADIVGRIRIESLEQLKELIYFFTNTKTKWDE